jgi:uncharacterized membrane protein YkoI
MALIVDADAARGKNTGRSPNANAQETLISRDRAAAIARSATDGRVLNIRLKQGKRPRYRVKMLLDGKRVRNLDVDARSGAILK